jgi:hypothetical protein
MPNNDLIGLGLEDVEDDEDPVEVPELVTPLSIVNNIVSPES